MNFATLICILLLPLAFSSAMAQDFKGGLKGGFDLSQIDGDKLSGYHKGGLIFGAYINRKLTPKLNWQMEMIYIGKGSKKGINPDKNQFYYRRIAVDYVEIPVLLQFWADKIKTNLEVGLSVATLIRSKEEDGFGETTIIGPFRPFEIGSLVGINYIFTDQWSGTARLTYSLSPIAVDNKVLFTVWNRYGGSYNNVLEFTINYRVTSGQQ